MQGTAGMQQAAVTDFHAAVMEDMLEEPAHKLPGVEVSASWHSTLERARLDLGLLGPAQAVPHLDRLLGTIVSPRASEKACVSPDPCRCGPQRLRAAGAPRLWTTVAGVCEGTLGAVLA